MVALRKAVPAGQVTGAQYAIESVGPYEAVALVHKCSAELEPSHDSYDRTAPVPSEAGLPSSTKAIALPDFQPLRSTTSWTT